MITHRSVLSNSKVKVNLFGDGIYIYALLTKASTPYDYSRFPQPVVVSSFALVTIYIYIYINNRRELKLLQEEHELRISRGSSVSVVTK